MHIFIAKSSNKCKKMIYKGLSFYYKKNYINNQVSSYGYYKDYDDRLSCKFNKWEYFY